MSRPRASLDELRAFCLEWRGIDPEHVCDECAGSGYKTYGDTSTWRKRAGGQAMTRDVCDRCWGSGEKYRQWPSWRRREP